MAPCRQGEFETGARLSTQGVRCTSESLTYLSLWNPASRWGNRGCGLFHQQQCWTSKCWGACHEHPPFQATQESLRRFLLVFGPKPYQSPSEEASLLFMPTRPPPWCLHRSTTLRPQFNPGSEPLHPRPPPAAHAVSGSVELSAAWNSHLWWKALNYSSTW